MIGQTLSHFKITAKLGEGGIGEVYRAEDTKRAGRVPVPAVISSASQVGGLARWLIFEMGFRPDRAWETRGVVQEP